MPKARPRNPADSATGRPIGATEEEWKWLIDAGDEAHVEGGIWSLWTKHGDAATAHFAQRHPGYRQSHWWTGRGFDGCPRPPQPSRPPLPHESELAILQRRQCLFPGEFEAALASKAKRPRWTQEFHESRWRSAAFQIGLSELTQRARQRDSSSRRKLRNGRGWRLRHISARARRLD
jgi:hypothetical protein